MDTGRFSWMVWCDGGNSMPINSEAPLEDQFVPTCESAASQFHARSMIQNHHHVLIEGKESSKALILKTLLNSLDEKYDVMNIPLSNCSFSHKLYLTLSHSCRRRHLTRNYSLDLQYNHNMLDHQSQKNSVHNCHLNY